MSVGIGSKGGMSRNTFLQISDILKYSTHHKVQLLLGPTARRATPCHWLLVAP
jgi:hypothetical protein